MQREDGADGAPTAPAGPAPLAPPARRVRRAAASRWRARGESAATFRLLFAHNPQPMWVYDRATLAFLEVNAAALRQYGYTRAEFLALRLPDIRPAEDVAPLLEDVRQARPALQDSGAWRHRRKDGALLDVEITSHTLTYAGRPAVLVCVHDMTEHKRTEAALRASEDRLRASEDRLRTLVGNAPIVLFAVDRDGLFTFSQGRGLEALGIRPDEHVGQSYVALYRDLPDSVAALRRALAGEVATTINEFKGLVFETRWMPTRDRGGAVSGVIGVSVDITTRRRLERRTRAALDALLAMAGALVQASDPDAAPDRDIPAREEDAAGGERPEDRLEGEERSAERTVAQRLSLLIRDVLGCRSVSLIALGPSGALEPVAVAGLAPAQEAAWRRRIAAWPREAAPVRALEERLRAGEVVALDTRRAEFAALRNPFGIERYVLAPLRSGTTVVGVLAAEADPAAPDPSAEELALIEAVARLAALVLERARLLREREEARSTALALREANRRMDEFLGIAGHELRTPLTTILGNLQMTQRRLLRLHARAEVPAPVAHELREAEHLLDRSEASLRRLGLLVSDLLDVSRIQAGRLRVRPEPCDLARLVREVVEEQRALAPTRTIRLELADDEVVPVEADAARMAQVLTNYLANALKYSAAEQPVTVGLAVDGADRAPGRAGAARAARVWVRDEGPGVAPEARERIWERFYRAEHVEHRHGSSVGLGLGLYISRTIIDQHGGAVGVESDPAAGPGATFWFTLPLARPA